MTASSNMVSTHTTQEVGRNTGNPLVIKGVERIESIVIRGEDVRRDAELYSHVLSRIMRRDFNFTSVKLFWYAKGYHRRARVQTLLGELMYEVEALENCARPYEMPSHAPAATCRMRIVSDEANQLFDALLRADRALHKLMHSPLGEVAEENMGPFLRTFGMLRRVVFDFSDQQRQQDARCDSTED